MILALRRVMSFYVSAQFALFLVVGGIAALCHWLIRFVFNWFVDFAWAIVLAYLVGILVAFVLNKIYVFPHSRRPLNFEISVFFLVNIGAFPVVWGVAYMLGEWVFVRYVPRELALASAHAIAITLPVFVNYALHKLITFRGA